MDELGSDAALEELMARITTAIEAPQDSSNAPTVRYDVKRRRSSPRAALA